MTVAEGNYRIVARKSAGINSVADLKGKRVATFTLSSAGYFLHLMLAREGLTLADVQVKEIVPYPAMVEALKNKEVDALSIWEPHSENALRMLGEDGVEFSGKGVYRELFNLNTTAGALADPEKRKRIVLLVRGIIDANKDMKKDPSRAQELVATAGGYTVDEVAQSWHHTGYIASFTDDLLDVMVKEEVWLAGLAKRQPRSREEIAKLIDRSVYEEAMALRP
jgi:NitT/TauT family transport system substrate-binding protein